MMRQYLSLKEQHRDAILFFRMGDFYEMFFEDAEIAARELGLTLTSRDKGKENGVPMAGVPHHAANGYIARLVRRGHRVAVCEQLGDPTKTKGLVERGVVEVVTAGTAITEDLVPEARNNYVAAAWVIADQVGFAAADISTGEFLLEDCSLERFREDVSRLDVAEWLIPEGEDPAFLPREAPLPVVRPRWWFDEARGRGELREQFKVQTLKAFDCDTLTAALGAGGALLDYLREVRGPDLAHVVRARRFGLSTRMGLDLTTRRNLELTQSLSGESKSPTLLGVLDRTVTSLGARRLRARLEQPLLERTSIEARLDAVEELVARPDETLELESALRHFRDVERLLSRAAYGKVSPRDLKAVADACTAAPGLISALTVFTATALQSLRTQVPDVSALARRLNDALAEDPPAAVGDGTVFRPGWDAGLDELRDLARGGKQWIARLQEQERQRTGISTLKVGFNRVFGYYLEVTSAQQSKVPEHYIRKQTLTNAERYVTPELKTEEERILSAEEKLKQLELERFNELRGQVVAQAGPLQELADAVGESDVLFSCARIARERNYVRPEITDDPVLLFDEARHPVVESLLASGDFVPNDLDLDARSRQIAIITGPNMAGKSTFLRQAGLLAIMAQMGSFVPARRARVGIVDRVFTRVGASDNIAKGQSTFMVEMEETATILNAATDRSLVLLDEVGRGTSTYDGLSIAWAVTEHLHDRPGKPRTLFATHFHELTSMAGVQERIVNLNVQVKEWNGRVIFLRKIRPGAADKSYGIHVAELAGVPRSVVLRAQEILERLESGRFARANEASSGSEPQLTLFEPVGHELLQRLDALDPNVLTPMEALVLMQEWKKRYGGGA